MKYFIHNYWYWNKEIPHEICQQLIELGEGKWMKAQTYASSLEVSLAENESLYTEQLRAMELDRGERQLKNIRKSDIVWLDEQWVYDLVWSYMLTANEEAGWKYNIVALEKCQVTRYTKDGFYTWHKDGTGSHNEVTNMPENKALHGNTRKLSMSIILNSDFEGGDFEIRDAEEGRGKKMQEGSIIVFPSFMVHRVAPVTKGTRYSLVAWFMGPPFK